MRAAEVEAFLTHLMCCTARGAGAAPKAVWIAAGLTALAMTRAYIAPTGQLRLINNLG